MSARPTFLRCARPRIARSLPQDPVLVATQVQEMGQGDDRLGFVCDRGQHRSHPVGRYRQLRHAWRTGLTFRCTWRVWQSKEVAPDLSLLVSLLVRRPPQCRACVHATPPMLTRPISLMVGDSVRRVMASRTAGVNTSAIRE